MGDKFRHYQTLRSLRQYVLVSHGSRALVLWTRASDDVWSMTELDETKIADLSVGARLDARELFAAAAEPSS